MNQDEFYRIRRLPPYVFAEVTKQKAKARGDGEDIIDLGMGNPDLPTPRHIIDKLKEPVFTITAPLAMFSVPVIAEIKRKSPSKGALALDEFALAAKKNASRLQMGAGLWRHAAQNYRQLEVRAVAVREQRGHVGHGLDAHGAGAVGRTDGAGDFAMGAGFTGRNGARGCAI